MDRDAQMPVVMQGGHKYLINFNMFIRGKNINNKTC